MAQQGYPGVTRTTLDLIQHWRRKGREMRLFFAQFEAAETNIFLTEARQDLRQGINVPVDEPTPLQMAGGVTAFSRYATKMATGSGKTMVMAMLAAWSILNKINNRGDGRFSDTVFVVCPNVTIKNRLRELDPAEGEASVYRTRDLVPPHLMPTLNQGRVLGRGIGGKHNILVMNDEAHHAYRIKSEETEDEGYEEQEDLQAEDEFVREATVWVEGLDRIHRLRGINFCVDLSATPFFLAKTGRDANRPFPWVVSEFGLTDAIESGLTKIPQLAVRDTTGDEIPGYFNIWQWIIPKLTAAERGGRKGSPKPEAILKWVNTPIAMLGGLREQKRVEWEQR